MIAPVFLSWKPSFTYKSRSQEPPKNVNIYIHIYSYIYMYIHIVYIHILTSRTIPKLLWNWAACLPPKKNRKKRKRKRKTPTYARKKQQKTTLPPLCLLPLPAFCHSLIVYNTPFSVDARGRAGEDTAMRVDKRTTAAGQHIILHLVYLSDLPLPPHPAHPFPKLLERRIMPRNSYKSTTTVRWCRSYPMPPSSTIIINVSCSLTA